MNIFALHSDPAIAASMHCDQHLHKMILESAQMLSTAMWKQDYTDPEILRCVYKPAYDNHPCTKWVCMSNSNALWLCELALSLEEVRQATSNCAEHSSTAIVKLIYNYITENFPLASRHNAGAFTFAGPLQFSLRPDLSIHEKYQAYYKQKYRVWLDTRQSMSYKGRPLPAFLREFATTIPHSSSQPYIE